MMNISQALLLTNYYLLCRHVGLASVRASADSKIILWPWNEQTRHVLGLEGSLVGLEHQQPLFPNIFLNRGEPLTLLKMDVAWQL